MKVEVLKPNQRKRVWSLLRRLRNCRSLHEIYAGNINERDRRRGCRPRPRLFRELSHSVFVPEDIWIQGLRRIREWLRIRLIRDECELAVAVDQFRNGPTGKFHYRWNQLHKHNVPN